MDVVEDMQKVGGTEEDARARWRQMSHTVTSVERRGRQKELYILKVKLLNHEELMLAFSCSTRQMVRRAWGSGWTGLRILRW